MAQEHLTASELARRIANRELSAGEALSQCLARIERENPRLNAIITLDVERAIARARELDAAQARGDLLGPLHGVPFTLKDCHLTAGMRTAVGSPDLEHHVPERDGTVAARLIAAGANLVGKTNVPPMLMSAQTQNPLFGRTSNPWNVERTVGGSSGGSAAAVAAGLVPFDIGSDMSGSVRIPAHFCGVLGLKPTAHRVPLTGHVPPPPGKGRPDRVLGAIGPLARSIDDLALTMQVLVGPDGEDLEVAPVPWRPAERREVRDLRLAYLPVFPGVPTSSAVRDTLLAVIAELERAGATIEERPPGFEIQELHRVWARFFELASGVFIEMMGVAPPVKAEEAPRATPADWMRTLDERDALARALEQLLGEFDAFVSPAGITTAFPHSPPRSPIVVDGEAVDSRYVDHYLFPFNLTGHPALVIPGGIAPDGLPVGVQLVGRRFGDERLLEVGRAVTEVTGGFRPPPAAS